MRHLRVLLHQTAEAAPVSYQAAYACAVCGISYYEKAAAEACARWCGKHPSCNLEIIKYAIKETV